MTTYNTTAIADAGKLCAAAASLPEIKAALAAAFTEAFINGMTTQEQLSAPAEK